MKNTKDNPGGDRTQVKGSKLTAEDQRRVLASYVHRFTGEHKPSWALQPRADGSAYEVQFVTDREWLENTRFFVNRDGRLSSRHNHCESNPTWPSRKNNVATLSSEQIETNADKGTPEANACLIAAAPDLLEALKTLLEMNHGLSDDVPEIVDARAAILKAEGKS